MDDFDLYDGVDDGQTHSFLIHKTLIDNLELCGFLLYYCYVFISCLNSHNGTHSLQRIH